MRDSSKGAEVAEADDAAAADGDCNDVDTGAVALLGGVAQWSAVLRNVYIRLYPWHPGNRCQNW